jgi:peptide/nickel transport system ATP-binding protein
MELSRRETLRRAGAFAIAAPTSRLSGGQQQRVAIARALAADPALLICDEPVTSLDAPSRAGILELLASLQRERRMAMLFISHDLAAVEHLAHRTFALEQGRISPR